MRSLIDEWDEDSVTIPETYYVGHEIAEWERDQYTPTEQPLTMMELVDGLGV